MTVISACCDVLEIEREESGDEWIGSIREQVAKLTDMTNKLVFLSRADEGTPAVPHSDFSLSEVTEEAVRAFRPVAEAQGKELTAEIGADIPMNGDLPRIRELLSILLDNAMKYSDPSGRIAVTLAPAGKGSVLTVSNTTAGVPKGDLSILFERFYRLDSSRNNETGGNGIGLSVAKAIVEQHGGTISAHSHDGVVILFRIRF